MLTTNQKGAIAETQIAAAAVELGIEVYRPVAEGGRFDMIVAFPDASGSRAVQMGASAGRRGRCAAVFLPSER